MKLRTIHEFEMLQRIRHFLDERPQLSAKPRIAELQTELHASMAATQTAARDQIQGAGEAAGGTANRRQKHQQLRAYLKDLARVARSPDRKTHPGLAAHFLLPTTRGYDALIVTARTMIKVATDLESTLIDHGLPETFLSDLTTLVDDFTTATNSKFDGLQTQVAGTSGLKFHASKGVKAAQKLDAILRAHFRNDPITLEVWHHARHIQVDPSPRPETPIVNNAESGAVGAPPSSASPQLPALKANATLTTLPSSLLSRCITENSHPPRKADFTLDLKLPKNLISR